MNFVFDHFKEFVQVIDSYMKLEGKLLEIFDPKVVYRYTREDDAWNFDNWYERFSEWVLKEQTTLSYEDVSKHDRERKRKEELEQFKKKADRII